MSPWSVFCVHSKPSQSARWQHLSFVRVYVRKFCIFAGWAAARHEMREMGSVFVWLGTQQWLPCLFQGHCSLVGSSDFPVSWPGTVLFWSKDEFFENINCVACLNASFPVQGLGEWWRQPAEQRWRCENRVGFGLQMHEGAQKRTWCGCEKNGLLVGFRLARQSCSTTKNDRRYRQEADVTSQAITEEIKVQWCKDVFLRLRQCSQHIFKCCLILLALGNLSLQ